MDVSPPPITINSALKPLTHKTWGQKRNKLQQGLSRNVTLLLTLIYCLINLLVLFCMCLNLAKPLTICRTALKVSLAASKETNVSDVWLEPGGRTYSVWRRTCGLQRVFSYQTNPRKVRQALELEHHTTFNNTVIISMLVRYANYMIEQLALAWCVLLLAYVS